MCLLYSPVYQSFFSAVSLEHHEEEPRKNSNLSPKLAAPAVSVAHRPPKDKLSREELEHDDHPTDLISGKPQDPALELKKQLDVSLPLPVLAQNMAGPAMELGSNLKVSQVCPALPVSATLAGDDLEHEGSMTKPTTPTARPHDGKVEDVEEKAVEEEELRQAKKTAAPVDVLQDALSVMTDTPQEASVVGCLCVMCLSY
jgi:hypothetical protein